MSYATINRCAGDQALQGRVSAACAAEGRTADANTAMYEVIWGVAAASDVEAAYASALASDNPDPGGDETVVTDPMILAHVQALLAAGP